METDIQIELTQNLTNKNKFLFRITIGGTVYETFPKNQIWETQVHNQFPSCLSNPNIKSKFLQAEKSKSPSCLPSGKRVHLDCHILFPLLY